MQLVWFPSVLVIQSILVDLQKVPQKGFNTSTLLSRVRFQVIKMQFWEMVLDTFWKVNEIKSKPVIELYTRTVHLLSDSFGTDLNKILELW